MLKRAKLIAKSYIRSKENEYAGYMGIPPQEEPPYPMKSPKTMGDASRQEAMYSGKGALGRETAKTVGVITGIAENLKTISQINHDVTEEEQKEKEAKMQETQETERQETSERRKKRRHEMGR